MVTSKSHSSHKKESEGSSVVNLWVFIFVFFVCVFLSGLRLT